MENDNSNNNKNNDNKTPSQLAGEYSNEIGELLKELANCVPKEHFMVCVNESIGTYDATNPDHNAVLNFKNDGKEKDKWVLRNVMEEEEIIIIIAIVRADSHSEDGARY